MEELLCCILNYVHETETCQPEKIVRSACTQQLMHARKMNLYASIIMGQTELRNLESFTKILRVLHKTWTVSCQQNNVVRVRVQIYHKLQRVCECKLMVHTYIISYYNQGVQSLYEVAYKIS